LIKVLRITNILVNEVVKVTTSIVERPFLSSLTGTTNSQPGFTFGYNLKNKKFFVALAVPLE
jgi:hypothetical protein